MSGDIKRPIRGSLAHREAVAHVQREMKELGYWQFGSDDKVKEAKDKSIEVAKNLIADLFEPIFYEHKRHFEKMAHDEKAKVWAEAFDFFLESAGIYLSISLDAECVFQLNAGLDISFPFNESDPSNTIGEVLSERVRIFSGRKSTKTKNTHKLPDISADYKFTDFSDVKEVAILVAQFKDWLCKEYAIDTTSVMVAERPLESSLPESAVVREAIRRALTASQGDTASAYTTDPTDAAADAVMKALQDLGVIP